MRTRADHSTYSAQTEGKSQHGRIVSELGLAIVGGAWLAVSALAVHLLRTGYKIRH